MTFLNDAYGGSAATDRNLYVDSVTGPGDPTVAGGALYNAGTQIFDFNTPTGPVIVGSGPDAFELNISEDAYTQGGLDHALFVITVDGIQVGTEQAATASHQLGQTQSFLVEGRFGAGPHTVGVNFEDDAYDGTSGADRNLYVDSVVAGGRLSGGLSLFGGGLQTLQLQLPSPPSIVRPPTDSNFSNLNNLTGTYGDDTIIALAPNIFITGLGGNDSIAGSTAGKDTILLGSPYGPDSVDNHDEVTIFGDGNTVEPDFIPTLNASVTVSGNATNTHILLGDGANTITLNGSGSTIAVGVGGDTINVIGDRTTVTIGADANQNTVNSAPNTLALSGQNNNLTIINAGPTTADLGNGNDVVSLTGGQTSLVFHGSGDMLFLHYNSAGVNAGGVIATVDDQSDGLRIMVDPLLQSLTLSHFGAAGVIDLRGGTGGYATASQAFAALQPDTGGGTILAVGAGAIHFAPGIQLETGNFLIS